jgi:hypothetical protein
LAAFGVAGAGWPWRSDRSYLREAGGVVRDQDRAGAAVLATDPRVAYYAKARPLIIGRTTWTELLRIGSERGARFVACEEADLAQRAKGFEAAHPPGVRLLAELPIPARRGRPPGRFLVYEILKNQ